MNGRQNKDIAKIEEARQLALVLKPEHSNMRGAGIGDALFDGFALLSVSNDEKVCGRGGRGRGRDTQKCLNQIDAPLALLEF